MIAIHIPDLRLGGAERVMVNLANEFASRGIETELVLSRVEGPYLSEVSRDVTLVDLEAKRYPLYTAMGACRPLYSYLRRERPTAMLSGLTRANVVALFAHRLARVETRMVVSEHNHLSSIVAKSDDVRMRVLPWLVRLTYGWADAIVAVSDGVAADFERIRLIDSANIQKIYNPVYPEIASESPKEPSHPWANGSTDDYELVLGVGSFRKQKDFPTLLRAVDHLSEKRDVRLVIVGEGQQRERLESFAAKLDIDDIVDFPGYVDDIFSYMKWADVFALSSSWEGFGNVIVEAMACGTPVVSTDCPSGPAEILCDGEYGHLVPVGDSRALSEAMRETLDSPIASHKLRKRARKFSVNRIADQYLYLLLDDEGPKSMK